MAQNTLPFHAMAIQFAETGRVLWVQVMPSGEVAAIDDPIAMAQKTFPFHVMACQFAEAGRARWVQITPSGEVAAMEEP